MAFFFARVWVIMPSLVILTVADGKPFGCENGWRRCANEGGTCDLGVNLDKSKAKGEVRFGEWYRCVLGWSWCHSHESKEVVGSIPCTKEAFGGKDPNPGWTKVCCKRDGHWVNGEFRKIDYWYPQKKKQSGYSGLFDPDFLQMQYAMSLTLIVAMCCIIGFVFGFCAQRLRPILFKEGSRDSIYCRNGNSDAFV